MRIALSEAVYMIWTMRCERVIGRGGAIEEEHPYPEVVARWHEVMRKRQVLDLAMTRSKYGKKALDRKMVIDTWSGGPGEASESASDRHGS